MYSIVSKIHLFTLLILYGLPGLWSGHLHSTCLPLALARTPAEYLLSPVTGQGTCIPLSLVRAPAYPCHWSGHLHTPVTGQGTCITLSLVKAPEYPCNWSGHQYPCHWSGHRMLCCIGGMGWIISGFFGSKAGDVTGMFLLFYKNRIHLL